jgi:hypothetical protein
VHKWGSPTNPNVYWIHYKPYEISKLFKASSGEKVSNGQVKVLLRSLGFKYKRMHKNLATGQSDCRNQQFGMICELIMLLSLNSPIISIDCKRKEVLGNLHRDGEIAMIGQVEVLDHDYGHLAEGKVIPHGIYDLQKNEGYMTIGTSHETAEFIKDNLLWWWDNWGKNNYPDAKNILILCDSGGANSYRHHAFKKQMQQLAQTIGIEIIICHYPPYTSKWNPIEHRLFAHVHQAMKGVPFYNYDIVLQITQKTTTKTGLKVYARLLQKEYDIGIKTDKNEVDPQRIAFNSNLNKLSYCIKP